MIVRSFQLRDYGAISQLLESRLSECCYEETMEAFARQLSWDCELVLVAEENSEIAGVIIGTIDNNRGYYYRVAVDTQYRRSGIGKALVCALKEKFIQRRVSKIMVSVDEHNEIVLHMFDALGFQTRDYFHSFKKLSIVAG